MTADPKPWEREPDYVAGIRLADGTRLATDVYLPAAKMRSHGCGTVMVRLPYGRRGPVAFLPGLATLVTERGWALVTQDVRGKFDSTGAREPFRNEVADGLATLEWIETQTWSDGRVVAAGDSYFGYTAWAAAASGHRSMRGLMTRVVSPTVSRHWMHRQGVFLLGNMTEWAASTWMGPEWESQSLDWAVRPSTRIIPTAFAGRVNSALDSWSRVGGTELEALDIDLASALRKPLVVAHVGGWWDIFQRGQIDTWRHSQRTDNGGIHLLTMDAVDHVLDPLRKPGQPAIDVVADPNLRRAGLADEWKPLFDVLDLVDAAGAGGASQGSVRWRPGHGEWQTGQSWPPADAEPLRLYPAEGSRATGSPEGGLLAFGPVRGGSAKWTHDPADPVPTVETDLWRPLLSGVDQRLIQERPDVATFTSLPFDRQLVIAGPARMLARTGGGAPSAHLVVTVSHVWPDGTAMPIADGVAVVDTSTGTTVVEIDLGHAAYVLPAGDRIRLAVAGSCYPRYALHPGTNEDPFQAINRVAMDQWLEVGDDTWLEIQLDPNRVDA